MRSFAHKSAILAVAFWAAGLWASLGLAAEPELSALVPADSLLVVSVNRPLRAVESPFLRDLAVILQESIGYRQFVKSPDHARIGQVLRFIEHSQGTDWKTAIDKLTAGGAILSVRFERIGGPAIVSVVIAADAEQTLVRFVDAGMSEIERQAAKKKPSNEAIARGAAAKNASPVVTHDYAGVACHQVGNGHFARVGRRLFLSSHRDALEALVDRQQGRSTGPVFAIPESLRIADSRGNPPLVQVVANVRQFRDADKNLQQALKLPSGDAGALFLLGGYFDLVRHSDSATAALVIEDDSLVGRVRFPAGGNQFTQVLKGFFAAHDNSAAAPLLSVPGAFFSSSSYRDFARLWNSRNELIAEAAVKQMEEGNARQRRQTSGMGFSELGLIDLVEMLGPHFRVVAAPQTETVYKTKLNERIPALGIAVDVRDETAFRERVVTPLNRLVNSPIVLLFAEVGTVQHRGATLTTIRFREDEQSATKMDKNAYQFNPAFALTHGHLVIGSTAEIVRGIVESLDNQLSEPIAPREQPIGTHVSSRQQVSFRELLAYAKEFEPHLLRAIAGPKALTPEEASQELDLVRRLFSRLGQVASQTTIGDNFFDFSLQIGGTASTPDNPATSPAP